MSTMFNTKYISSFLAQAAQDDDDDKSTFVDTWNGAKEFRNMGSSFLTKLVEFDFKFVIPKECFKTRILDKDTRNIFDTHYANLIATLNFKDTHHYETLFRYLFYSRGFRDTGKGSRLGFYYLFEKLHYDFPKICNSMLSLIPEYGCFADLDNLVELIGDKILQDVIDVYVKHMNLDCIILFGKEVAKVTINDLETFLKKNVIEFMKGKQLSLAFKWLKSSGKHNSKHRLDILTKIYFPNGGLKELLESNETEKALIGRKRLCWCDMMLRKIKSCVGTVLDVVEQKMCSNHFSEINMSSVPAGAMTKYTKAFSNELLKKDVSKEMDDTGNRHPDNKDLIFWNLNNRTPGFPVEANFTGIQMVSGFSQTLMNQVFTGKFVYEEIKDDSRKIIITPEETLMRALYSSYYDKVGSIFK
jgi:hypothetical protein